MSYPTYLIDAIVAFTDAPTASKILALADELHEAEAEYKGGLDYRSPEPERKLKRNRAKCLKCKDIVESKTTHDFRYCKCGAMFVDGGLAYLRRGAEDLSMVKEMSTYEKK